ncbi:MAG: DUF479 domain-containing protein [Bacteroidetes bacterium]|nr:DUF479 domain-containing protein [Bacteroidota bacterium]
MNFLAHAILSFNNNDVLYGNIISDFLKGKSQYNYSGNIRKGIVLHRAIDEFTDSHPLTKEVKKMYSPNYRLYSGPLADITFDYFLANDKIHFPDYDRLNNFVNKIYSILEQYNSSFPEQFNFVFKMMKEHNWLYNYRFDEGIALAFRGLVKRSKFLTDFETAFTVFKNNKPEIKNIFDAFFPQLEKFAFEYYNNYKS